MHDATSPKHDALVTSAIHHWAPRFVTNGVPLTDFQEVTAGISHWADWCRAWSARAAVHEAIGRQALADGFNLSAGQHLTTAAVCYHFAKFVFVLDVNEMRAAHMKAVECRKPALPHLRPAGRIRAHSIRGQVVRRRAGAPARGRRAAADRRHVHGPGFGERGNGQLRVALSCARTGDAEASTAREQGESRIRNSDPRRLRSCG